MGANVGGALSQWLTSKPPSVVRAAPVAPIPARRGAATAVACGDREPRHGVPGLLRARGAILGCQIRSGPRVAAWRPLAKSFLMCRSWRSPPSGLVPAERWLNARMITHDSPRVLLPLCVRRRRRRTQSGSGERERTEDRRALRDFSASTELVSVGPRLIS